MTSIGHDTPRPGGGDMGPVGGNAPLTGNVSPPAAGLPDNREVDTLSEAQYLIDAIIANASNPILSAPNNSNISLSGGGVEFGMSVMQQLHDIKMGILDGWSKNIREIAEREERDRNSPEYKAKLDRESSQYLAELARMSPEASMNAALSSPEFMKMVSQLGPIDKTNVTESARAYATVSGVESFAAQRGAAAAGLIGMMGGVGGVAVIDTVIQGNPLVDSVNQIAQAVSTASQTTVSGASAAIQIDYSAMLAMMGGFFSANILQFTNAEAVSGTAKGQVKNLAYAQKFAENTRTLVNDPEFDSFLRNNIIPRVPGFAALSETQQMQMADKLTAMIKIVLLASAVAVLSKAETGWINPAEFKDLVAGKVNFGKQNDIRNLLVADLQGQMAALNRAAPGTNDKLIDALAAVFAKQNTTGERTIDERMMRTVRTFEEVGHYLDAQRPISSSTG